MNQMQHTISYIHADISHAFHPTRLGYKVSWSACIFVLDVQYYTPLLNTAALLTLELFQEAFQTLYFQWMRFTGDLG